jgi:hypothetical protein
MFITQQRQVVRPSSYNRVKLHYGLLGVYLQTQWVNKCSVQYTVHVLVRCWQRLSGGVGGERVPTVNQIHCHKSPFQFVNKSSLKGIYVQYYLIRNPP